MGEYMKIIKDKIYYDLIWDDRVKIFSRSGDPVAHKAWTTLLSEVLYTYEIWRQIRVKYQSYESK